MATTLSCRQRTAAIRAIILRLGPDCTHADVCEAAKKEGVAVPSRDVFRWQRRQAFPTSRFSIQNEHGWLVVGRYGPGELDIEVVKELASQHEAERLAALLRQYSERYTEVRVEKGRGPA